MISQEMKQPMAERQVISVLRAIDQEQVEFSRSWLGFSRVDYTTKLDKIASPYHIKVDRVASPYHIKSLIGAGLVQPRYRGSRSWIYRLTDLGKKLLDMQD